ncbi:unnamed protein product [Arctogadus glacialis]
MRTMATATVDDVLRIAMYLIHPALHSETEELRNKERRGEEKRGEEKTREEKREHKRS